MSNLSVYSKVVVAATMLLISLFFVSCEREVITPQSENELSSIVEASSSIETRKMVLSDRRGKSKITLDITGPPEVINVIDPGDFEVEPVFSIDRISDVAANIPKNEISQEKPDFEVTSLVKYVISNMELEEGAIGYKIKVDRKNEYSRNRTCSFGEDQWISYRDNAIFRADSDDFPGVFFYYNTYSNPVLILDTGFTWLSNGWQGVYSKPNSWVIAARVFTCPNSNDYTLLFFNI